MRDANDQREKGIKKARAPGQSLMLPTNTLVPFVLLISVEWFFLQEITMLSPQKLSIKLILFAWLFRAISNTLLAALIVSILNKVNRLFVFAIMKSGLVFALVAYTDTLMRPLSLLTLQNNAAAGAKFIGVALDAVSFQHCVILATLLVLQIVVLVASLIGREEHRRVSPRIVLFVAVLTVSLEVGVSFKEPLSKILTTRTVGRIGYVRGYVGSWFAEWWYLDSDKLLLDALKHRQQGPNPYDTWVNPLQSQMQAHIIVLQVESLAADILHESVSGQEITPRLNARVRDRDYLVQTRLGALHDNGSCDSDFGFLNASAPSRHINTYKLESYPFEKSLVSRLNERDYSTRLYHGYGGNFYARRSALERMGFDELLFAEDLLQRNIRAQYPIDGVWSDQQVLTQLSHSLNQLNERASFSYVITMSSHAPYTWVSNSHKVQFSKINDESHKAYLNAIADTDLAMDNFFQSLNIPVTVILFGDHTPPGIELETLLGREKLQADTVTHEEVPLLIFNINAPNIPIETGMNHDPVQHSEMPQASRGNLPSVVDVARLIAKVKLSS